MSRFGKAAGVPGIFLIGEVTSETTPKCCFKSKEPGQKPKGPTASVLTGASHQSSLGLSSSCHPSPNSGLSPGHLPFSNGPSWLLWDCPWTWLAGRRTFSSGYFCGFLQLHANVCSVRIYAETVSPPPDPLLPACPPSCLQTTCTPPP